MAMVKDTTKATSDKIASVMPGPKVPVVEVREESLEEMPSGRERALAYERERRNSFWFFGPIDFQEPEMPEPGAELDGSLLPPRM